MKFVWAKMGYFHLQKEGKLLNILPPGIKRVACLNGWILVFGYILGCTKLFGSNERLENSIAINVPEKFLKRRKVSNRPLTPWLLTDQFKEIRW